MVMGSLRSSVNLAVFDTQSVHFTVENGITLCGDFNSKGHFKSHAEKFNLGVRDMDSFLEKSQATQVLFLEKLIFSKAAADEILSAILNGSICGVLPSSRNFSATSLRSSSFTSLLLLF